MAFQTSVLPSISAATTELWPSLSSTMVAPWKMSRKQPQSPRESSSKKAHGNQVSQRPFSSVPELSKSVTPDFIRDLPPSISSAFIPRMVSRTPFNIQNMVVAMPRGIFNAANPIARRAALFSSQSRQMSTRSQFSGPKAASSFANIIKSQQRTLFGSTPSRNLLAHMEETANKNPNSATAQNAFYQALLRANMPAIIVERYQTNQFASNAACEGVYQKALGMIGSTEGGVVPNQFAGQPGAFNNAHLQAIGQAVAASSRGGNVAISRGAGVNGGSGVKGSPLHVVVEETIGGSIFRWVKFLMYFGLFTYVSMIAVAMMVDFLQTFKKVGGKNDNEAKAENQTVRFSDVHGCDEAKDELQELVDFLKNPDKFSTLGGKLPKGVLLVGPPGTGKTLLARAVAGEAGVPFFFMSGSEFDEVYVGVGAKRVRDLFAAAKSKSPAIVFIDELDAIGGKRNARDAAYVKQTLNQLLTELDGFEQNSGVIILAATNFPQMLDKALTRPGRFDRNVVVGLPDVRGRMAILKHHMKKVIAAKDVSLETLAAGTPGFSGAELENIINQAAVRASKAKAQAVSMLDFEWAKDKVMMGAEKKSMIITQKEKESTAYHEAGHALVCLYTPGANQLHKVTIMPRGLSLGMTMHLPEVDKYSMTKNEYEAQIDVSMGGKVAEEIIYGPEKVSSGASSDLQSATRIAYAMVTRYGMSPELGNVDLASNHDKLSPATKEKVESEVRRLIEEGRVRARNVLESKRKELEYLAKALVDYETLDRAEVAKVVKGQKLEGRMIMPSGNIKIPGLDPPPAVVGLPEVPEIPGSTTPPGGKEPPIGGAVA